MSRLTTISETFATEIEDWLDPKKDWFAAAAKARGHIASRIFNQHNT